VANRTTIDHLLAVVYPAPIRNRRLEGSVGVKPKRKRKFENGHQIPPMPKISQSLLEFAGDFIRVGTTLPERQSRLNAASSAWNMACNTPELRKKHLDRYVQSYAEFNPTATAEELANLRKDMETLVGLKIKMFPNDLRQVLQARILSVNGKDRVEAVAARLQ
jgi:hypothetical protein